MGNTRKIRLNTSVVGGDYNYAAGEEVDAPVDRAIDLVNAGHAEFLDLQKQPKKETAASKAAEAAEKR